jgi:hypothetical protein
MAQTPKVWAATAVLILIKDAVFPEGASRRLVAIRDLYQGVEGYAVPQYGKGPG